MTKNKQIYEEKISKLVQEIWRICSDESIPFSFTCTVDVYDEGTVVSKGVQGSLNPSLVDPYTRINILLSQIEPDVAEAIYFQLLTMFTQQVIMEGGTDKPTVDEDPAKQVNVPINGDYRKWLDEALKDLGL